MENEQVERLLKEARNKIPVNEELKTSLRKSLIKKRRPVWKKPWLYAGAAAVLLLGVLFNQQQIEHVTAQELNVTNAVSFFDIGRGDITAVAHDHGQLYVSIKGEGIFLYKETGLQKLGGSEASTLHFDADGKTLLYSVNGNIVQLNIKMKREKIIVKGSTHIHYDQPVWKNDSELYAVKQEEDREQIVQISLKTKKETVVADGSKPVLMRQADQLVYEKAGAIIMQDLQTNKQQPIDHGTDPSVSMDGRYLSYVKEENGIDDVWITDADLKTKKKVTANPSVKADNKQTGVYQYSSPVWDSGKHQLYVMKKRTLDKESKQVQIMRIELAHDSLSAEQTVERYLQALIVRDDDYARSLMENPPEFLTYSNPHQTGYRILKTEKRDEAVFIQAELYREDTARPYYSITAYEFELKHGENGYSIHRAAEMGVKEFTALDEMKDLQLIQGQKQEHLFSLEDVPKQKIKTNAIRLGSLLWNQTNEQIVFSVQEMTEKAGVTIWTYNPKSRQFAFIDRIDSIGGQKGIGIEGMTASPDGRYLALDLFAENEPQTTVLLYDLKKGKRVAQLDQSHSLFWQGDRFLFERYHGDQAMLSSKSF
ncbi:hypothetical protein AC623_08980 [Bacillus sp. FJAT-27231]|uniref:hypothetical protein n=1 Tax=Bacillus sp. FJAT-27231 TaxID=1679168 RepID=UPI0006711358|nr:hypothetical protein [Bacillus sp. FJAT-27231]KMY54082.1 hypothetical protein AC623_08980 [Bacillus sp. FJAT-27231]